MEEGGGGGSLLTVRCRRRLRPLLLASHRARLYAHMNPLHSAGLKVQTSGGRSPTSLGREWGWGGGGGFLHSLSVQYREPLGLLLVVVVVMEVRQEEPVMLNSIHMCASPHVSFM